MKLSCRLAILLTFMLVCTCTYTVTAQGGCNTLSSSNGLITGTGKTGVFPNIQADPGDFRQQVGGYFVSPWALFSATQVFQNGLWCQVNSDSNGGMGSNIGDMFYSTGNGPDDFTVVPTSEPSNTNNIPFQQLKCTNQIGVIVDDDMTNFQGFLKCNTTISNLMATFTNLNINTYYWVMYTDTLFNGYTGPSVDSTMTLSIISSRDADPNIIISLSFTVSFGPPSRITCTRDSVQLIFVRGPDSRITREVIRSRYINSTHPDMSRVTVNLDSQPRIGATYNCTVTVEGRTNIASGGYNFDTRGSGSSTVTVTVAGTPTAVTVSRTAATSVRVSWTAPSTGPALGGYEVFYQSSAGSNGSSTTTTSSELTLTGLVLEQTYSIFVVAFGPVGAPVLPSAHSNTEMITLSILPPTGITLAPATTSILVSWTAPQFYTPDSYSVTISCVRLCDNVQTFSGLQLVSNGGATSHTITSLDPGNNCTVRVAAMLSGTSSESGPVSANTLSEAPNGAPTALFQTSIQSRSFTVFWGLVLCPNQRGPITGYRLRYSNGTSIVNTTDVTHVLTGLTPFTNYSVQVAAVNAGGTGPYSIALTVETLQDIPGPVSDLSATPGVVQLTISWTAPSEPNGVITMYQVTHNSTGVLNYTNTSATQLTLRDLSLNTAVEYSVRAYTIIGPGESVTHQASTTDIPPISIESVNPISCTAVRVSWSPLSVSVVDHYTVHYINICGNSQSQTFPASASSGVVSGLQEGQQYQFSVSLSLTVSGQTFNSTSDSMTVTVLTDCSSSQSSSAVLFTNLPSSSPTSCPSYCLSQCPSSSSLGYSAGLGVVSVIMIVSLIGNLVLVIILLMRTRKSFDHNKTLPSDSDRDHVVYDQPELLTKDGDDVEMKENTAYGTAHQILSTDEIQQTYEAVNVL